MPQGRRAAAAAMAVAVVLAPAAIAGFANATGSPVAVGSSPRGVAIGDVDGDGDRDLAVPNFNDDNVSILLNNGSGGFTAAAGSPFAAGTGPARVAFGLLNGDANLDLAIANTGSGNVTILLGNGAGGFTQAAGSPYAAGSLPQSIAVGRIDGDADLDIAVANVNSDNVTVLLGDNAGGFTAAAGSPFAVGDGPTTVAIGRLDADANPDLAVSNSNSANVSILLGDGSGGFTPAAGSPIAVGGSASALAVGSFDGDGNVDLAVGRSNLGDVRILTGNGSGGFTAGASFTAVATAFSIAAGDLDGDGDDDLAVGNDSGTTVAVLLGDGAGGFAAASGSPVTAGNAPRFVARGDLNGDGMADLAAANRGSNSVSILLNTFTVPGAPTGASATAGNGQATVSFTAPAADGGTPILDYTVTASPGGQTATGTSTSLTVTGLTNGTSYTFTVRARNSTGTSAASAASNAVTPLGAPGAPSGVSAAAGDRQAAVGFSAAAANGSPITGYTVTASPGDVTASGSASPITVSGLTNGTSYTFTVTASNSAGTGPASAASNAVTPTAPAGVPGAPTRVSVAVGDGQATVSCSPPADDGGAAITSYTVTVSPGGIHVSGASCPITVTGLAVGVSYTFTVTATNGAGTSASSAGPQAFVADVRSPTTPAGLTGRFKNGALVLSWQPATDNVGVDHYQLYLETTPLLQVPGTSANVSVRVFHPRGRSVFTLRALDAAGNRSESDGTVVVVPVARPKTAPKQIPAWAWKLFVTQQHGGHGKPKQPWYAAWKTWRLHPFKLAR